MRTHHIKCFLRIWRELAPASNNIAALGSFMLAWHSQLR